MTALTDALAPVRAAILRLAEQDAQRLLSAADAGAAVTLGQADAEAERLRAAARAEAEADAAALLATERSRADRAARAEVLRARRTAYDELASRARVVAGALADDPAVRTRLGELARAGLGPEARLLAAENGVVVAEAGDRRVSYSVASLADDEVDRLLASREGSGGRSG